MVFSSDVVEAKQKRRLYRVKQYFCIKEKLKNQNNFEKQKQKQNGYNKTNLRHWRVRGCWITCMSDSTKKRVQGKKSCNVFICVLGDTGFFRLQGIKVL